MPDPADFAEKFLADVYDAFAAYVSLDELRAVIEATTYEALRASISGATREEILAVAKEKAAALVTRVSDEMVLKMADTIATGLEAQIGPEAIARKLKDGLGLDSVREKQLENYRKEQEAAGLTGDALERAVEEERQRLISDRARVIAQNEIGTALEEGAYAVALARGNTHKVSITVGDARVSAICQACQAQGPIPVKDAFLSGNVTPPHHVRCRCTASYLTDTGKGEVDRAAERSRARDEKLKAALAAADAAEKEASE